MQRAISGTLEIIMFNEAVNDQSTTDADVARLLDCSDRYAYKWLDTYPSCDELTMTDEAFCICFRSSWIAASGHKCGGEFSESQ